MSEEEPSIAQYIIVSFMLLITFYLTFLYIKTKEFHTYACYNVIIMSIMIFVGSVIIMIPNTLGNDYTQFFIGILESFSYKIADVTSTFAKCFIQIMADSELSYNCVIIPEKIKGFRHIAVRQVLPFRKP